MNKNDLYLGLAIVAGSFIIYKLYFEKKDPTTQEQVVASFNSAGLTAYKSRNLETDSVFVDTGRGTTYQFQPGDFDKLNPAQKILIGLDKVIPGSWLTRAVLG